MKLLEGIQLHELVLIILGFILGLVLIFVFLYGAMRGKPNLKLLFGFTAPLIMIGYPSIQSVEFSKDVVKIDKLVELVNQNPTDTLATKALRAEISTLPKSRCVTSSDAMTTIANAQAAVGLYDSAKVTIQKAVDLNPKSVKAMESHKEIEDKWRNQKDFEGKAERLKSNIERLNDNPNSRVWRDSVAFNLEEIKHLTPIHASQREMLAVSMAAAIVGENQAAEQVVDDVLRVSPNQPDAKRLKEAIRDKKIEKRFPRQEPVKQKPQPQKPVTPKPNSRTNQTEASPAPPVVAAPVTLKVDTAWSSRLIPKSTTANFVKWDKEQ